MSSRPPPNFRDLNRIKQIQAKKYLSAKSVISRGGISGNDVYIPPVSTPTLTSTSSITPTPSITPTSSVTPTLTLTPTSSVTPSITPTLTQTPTITVTPTVTQTQTPASTPEPLDSVKLTMLGYSTFNNRGFNIYTNTTTGSAAYVYQDVMETISGTTTLTGTGVRTINYNYQFGTFPEYRTTISNTSTVANVTTRTVFLTVFSCNVHGQPSGTITYISPGGLEFNPNSKTNNLSTIDISNCANLKYLVLDNYGQGMTTTIPVITITGALKNTMEYISVRDTFNLQQLQANDCQSLTAVYFSSVSPLSAVSLSGCNNLKSIYIYNVPNLSSTDISGVGALEDITLGGTTLTNIPSSNIYTLRNVDTDGNFATLSSLYVGVTGLQYLRCGYEDTQINLDSTFAAASSLYTLYFDTCTLLREININTNTNLGEAVIIYNSTLSAININTTCPSLSFMDCSFNNLGVSKLNSLYTALPDRSGRDPGDIYVSENPGYGGSNTTIATNKNWNVN